MSRSPEQELSESAQWKLLDGLFNQRAIILVALLYPLMGTMIGFFRTGQIWFVGWGVATSLIIGARYALEEAYHHRPDTHPPLLWRRRFTLGAWTSAAALGAAVAASVHTADTFTQMVFATLATAYVMGAAARHSNCPPAAIGAVLVVEVPLFAACLATGNIFYFAFAGFVGLFCFTALQVVRNLYDQTVLLLRTDEEKVVLVDAISRSNLELEALNRQLKSMAGEDALTGISNRRSFDEFLATAARSVRRQGFGLSLLMVDIDLFKDYNDRYGHQVGDDCLRRVAHALKSGVRRPTDTLARYGGEEFSAILPQTDRAGAAALAESLRAAVEALAIEHARSAAGFVTVSIGVATIGPGLAWTTAELVSRADQALYDAKHGGRNRVHVAYNDEPGSAHASESAEEAALPL